MNQRQDRLWYWTCALCLVLAIIAVILKHTARMEREDGREREKEGEGEEGKSGGGERGRGGEWEWEKKGKR